MGDSASHLYEFQTHCPAARKVYLSGDFNDWSATPMEQVDAGQWALKVELRPGKYRFQYLVERADGAAPEPVTDHSYGLIYVPAPRAQT